jgi:hypothetical protein
MSHSASTLENPEIDNGSIGLWGGVIGVPALWSLQFLLGYALPTFACEKIAAIHHVLTILFVIASLFVAVLARRQWKSTGGQPPDVDEGGPMGRRQFLGALGALVSLMFALLILAQGMPSFFFDGCAS